MLERSLWHETIAGCMLMNYGAANERPPSSMPEEMHKYWAQRYRLFLKYDEGILLDQGE